MSEINNGNIDLELEVVEEIELPELDVLLQREYDG